jgi:RHS repeat-associated protein
MEMYSYDGEGRRVMKMKCPSSSQCTTANATSVSVFVYDAAGMLTAEYGPVTGSGTSYLTADHLGSTRVVTDSTGLPQRCYDYLPFGEEIPNNIGGRAALTCYSSGAYPAPPDIETQKFTGKERDAETGLDYFGARYFSGAQGRFTSPDPLLTSAKLGNPQTWNRYSYAIDNPLRYTDPTGMYVEDDTSRQQQLWTTYINSFNQAGKINYTRNYIGSDFVLPQNPSGLGPEWVNDTRHRAPNGSRWVRGDGEQLDFDKGQPGKTGWKGKDHWHVTHPGQKDYDQTLGDRGHVDPGKVIDLPDFAPKVEPGAPVPTELKSGCVPDGGCPGTSIPPYGVFPMPIPTGIPPFTIPGLVPLFQPVPAPVVFSSPFE